MSLRDIKALARTLPKLYESIKAPGGCLAFPLEILPMCSEDFSSGDEFDEHYTLPLPVSAGDFGLDRDDKV